MLQGAGVRGWACSSMHQARGQVGGIHTEATASGTRSRRYSQRPRRGASGCRARGRAITSRRGAERLIVQHSRAYYATCSPGISAKLPAHFRREDHVCYSEKSHSGGDVTCAVCGAWRRQFFVPKGACCTQNDKGSRVGGLVSLAVLSILKFVGIGKQRRILGRRISRGSLIWRRAEYKLERIKRAPKAIDSHQE